MPLSVPTILSGRRLARLLSVVLPVVALLAWWPAAAQDSQLRTLTDRVDRLQRELSDLESSLANGQPAPTGTGANSTAQTLVRIEQIEEQVRQLTGQIEELNYKFTQLDQKLDRINADTDLRLKELEGTAPAAGAAPANASPSPAGAPQTPGGAAAAPSTPSGSAPPATGAAAAAPAGTGASGAPAPAVASSSGVLGTITEKDLTRQEATGPNRQAAATAAAAAASGAKPAAAPAGTPAPGGATALASAPAGQLPAGTADEQYHYAFGLLRQQDYPNAEAALRAFVAQHPGDPLAGNAQYWLGETYYARKDYRRAAVAFAEGYQKYPTSPKAPDNLLKLGLALAQIGEKSDACEALAQLGKQFPSAAQSLKDRATRERQRIGCA